LTEYWIDDAPGERRAAVVENGAIVEMHLHRFGQFLVGETGSGRIVGKTPTGTYLQSDDGRELLVRHQVALAEGARTGFEVTRGAIAEPGLIKLAEAKIPDSIPASPITADQLWLELVGGALSKHDVSDAFDIAIAGVSHVDDATISFQRTKAGLVFDIDGTGDPFAINIAAAIEIARLLRLYQVGAMVMVDFIAVDSKSARQAVAEAFDAAAAFDPRPYERTAVNGFGMMQVVRPRPMPSVLDQFFGTRIASLSDETQALWLLREAAGSSGFGARTITATPAVATLLQSPSWQPLLDECERLTGAPLAIVADEQIGGYGHVHVSQS
jgi:hypothetical protein